MSETDDRPREHDAEAGRGPLRVVALRPDLEALEAVEPSLDAVAHG
jgi:hypothetical protein